MTIQEEISFIRDACDRIEDLAPESRQPVRIYSGIHGDPLRNHLSEYGLAGFIHQRNFPDDEGFDVQMHGPKLQKWVERVALQPNEMMFFDVEPHPNNFYGVGDAEADGREIDWRLRLMDHMRDVVEGTQVSFYAVPVMPRPGHNRTLHEVAMEELLPLLEAQDWVLPAWRYNVSYLKNWHWLLEWCERQGLGPKTIPLVGIREQKTFRRLTKGEFQGLLTSMFERGVAGVMLYHMDYYTWIKAAGKYPGIDPADWAYHKSMFESEMDEPMDRMAFLERQNTEVYKWAVDAANQFNDRG